MSRRRRWALAIALLVTTLPVVARGAPGERRLVTVTFYTDAGTMYGGRWTYLGAAACSWDMPLGTVVVFDDGRTVTCEDRGLLGSSGWVDIWCPWGYWGCVEDIELRYGDMRARVPVTTYPPR